MRVLPALVAAALVAGGCGQLMGPGETVQGTYDLRSVAGSPIPFRMGEAPRVDVVSRRIVLDPYGRFEDETELLVEVDGVPTPLPTHRTGAYVVDGSSITLAYTSGRLARSRLRGDVLELNDRGVLFRLER